MDNNMYNNTYANCVGYALEQCYSSCICITKKGEIESDEEHLEMLKELVKEYKQACEIVDDENNLQWQVSDELLSKIENAKVLSELY